MATWMPIGPWSSRSSSRPRTKTPAAGMEAGRNRLQNQMLASAKAGCICAWPGKPQGADRSRRTVPVKTVGKA